MHTHRRLDAKSKAWAQLNARRYSTKAKRAAGGAHAHSGQVSQEMAPEYLRKIVRDHGDMSTKRFRHDKRIYLGSLKFLPHAILKLLENMPMPWEQVRNVKVLYHVTGAITLVNELPLVIEPVYVAQWASMWVAMRREKKDRLNFKRMRFPPFDDEEPPIDYGEQVLAADSVLEAVQMELSEEDDDAIFDWFYDHRPLLKSPFVNGPSYRAWRLPVQIMANLQRIAWILTSDVTDPNYFYLFNRKAFFTAKALSIALPGGPAFEPLYRDADSVDEDWNEFNDIHKLITRRPIRSEYKVAFPFLYSSRPRSVALETYHHLSSVYLRNDDVELPPFYFDPVLNVIPPHFEGQERFSTTGRGSLGLAAARAEAAQLAAARAAAAAGSSSSASAAPAASSSSSSEFAAAGGVGGHSASAGNSRLSMALLA